MKTYAEHKNDAYEMIRDLVEDAAPHGPVIVRIADALKERDAIKEALTAQHTSLILDAVVKDGRGMKLALAIEENRRGEPPTPTICPDEFYNMRDLRRVIRAAEILAREVTQRDSHHPDPVAEFFAKKESATLCPATSPHENPACKHVYKCILSPDHPGKHEWTRNAQAPKKDA